jgi:hypothetical protein
MGQKRQSKQSNIKLLNQDVIKITNTNGSYLFEIGDIITTDPAEAVALMMRIDDLRESFWKRPISINPESIDVRKCLYWLSGGDLEWITLHNYCKSWINCEDDFEEEFGFLVKSIIKKSKTLEDIKNNFIKYLNLPTLYEFALEKNLIR